MNKVINMFRKRGLTLLLVVIMSFSLIIPATFADEGTDGIDENEIVVDAKETTNLEEDGFESDIEAEVESSENVEEQNEIAHFSGDIKPLSEGTGDILDGDYAYLTSVNMETGSNETGYSMTTGTAPWDTKEGAGNDITEKDTILRTYDTATYTVTFDTMVRSDAPYGNYVKGNLYFELVVKGDEEEIQWEPSSMTWLDAKYGVYTETTENYNGESYQILRGYITLEPATESGHAIGNTTQTLSLVLRALSMKNGDSIIPQFTFFLAYNDVGLSAEQYSDWGTENYNGPIVTFDGKECTITGHGAEYATVTAPQITVSAIPSYNIALANSGTTYQVVSGFDFSTGNNYAMDTDAGEKYGRLGNYGIMLQIVGKDATNGLRGVEVPKSGEKINATFTINLTSQYTANGVTYQTDGTNYGLKTDDGSLSDYAPLIWSFEANTSGSTQQDDRVIPSSLNLTYSRNTPYNKISGTPSSWYYYCNDGGTWRITKIGNGQYEITVTDCIINMGQLPYANPSAGNATTYTYYNPNNINYNPSDSSKNNYWEVQKAVVSTGECWILQPFYAHEKQDTSDPNSTYIAQVIDDGTFNVYLKDSEMEIYNNDGIVVDKTDGTSNQVTTSDDSSSMDFALLKPGSISQHIVYVKYNYAAYNDALTDGCYSNGKDWTLAGNQLCIEAYVSHDGAEDEYTGIGYDSMIKFDDVFFEPNGSVSYSTSSNYDITCLWGAKADGSGWDHQGLSPDESGYDTEMINATPDDLVFYSSLNALQADGKTCVAVMLEYRGGMLISMNHLHFYVKGTAKTDAEIDQVYMVSPYCRAWNKGNVADAMATDPNSEFYENSSGALEAILNDYSTSELKTLAKQYIPSHLDGNKYGNDFPTNTYWINGGRDGTSSYSNNIRNYKKAYYTENGFDGNGTGVTSDNYYGDSCLLVGYQSGLTMRVVQPTTSGNGTTHDKNVFDMDTNQTIVDYEVSPFITRNNGEEFSESVTYSDVIVTVELPENLFYLDGSSYIGGLYTTNGEGKQGSVTDGTQLTEGIYTTFTYTIGGKGYTVGVVLTVTEQNGKQVLTYSFTDVPITGSDITELLENIYFSCEISSGAVKNNDELDIIASIVCSGDINTDVSTKTDGQSTVGIIISKNTAISLVKTADNSIIELGNTLDYTIDIGDNSDNPMTMVAVDNIPYNGDGRSTFGNDNCIVYTTEFSAYDVTTTRDLSDFFFFYTTNKDFADMTSADYPDGTYFITGLGGSDVSVNQRCLDDGWVLMSMNDEGKDVKGHEYYDYTDFPENEQVYAIVGIGIVEGNDDINMHIALKLSDPMPGDSVVNRITQQHAISTTDEYGNVVITYEDLADTARIRVVKRDVSGLAWFDSNIDGIRDDNEDMLSNIGVALYRTDVSQYDSNGSLVMSINGIPLYNSYDVFGNKVDSDITALKLETGEYEFTCLESGTYYIVFTNIPSGYGMTACNVGSDSTDSDAYGFINSSHTGVSLAYIPDIVLPALEDMTSWLYESEHNDIGIIEPTAEFTVQKIDNKSESLLPGAEFTLTYNDGTETLITGDDGQATTGLKVGSYTLQETKAPVGYLLDKTVYSITVSLHDNGDEAWTADLSTDIEKNQDDLYVIGDDSVFDMPNAGSSGVIPWCIVGAVVLAGTTCAWFGYRKRIRQ